MESLRLNFCEDPHKLVRTVLYRVRWMRREKRDTESFMLKL